VHAIPRRPHAASVVPSKHWLPVQQPLQFVALHAPLVWHTLPRHAAPAPHGMHDRPPAPHASLSEPATQLPVASQQPTQLDGPHAAACWHVPSTHSLPPVQTEHESPDVPHAFAAVPVRHRPLPSQQPKQLTPLHAVVVQSPPEVVGNGTHCSPVAAHVTHASPALPHADGEVPVTHPAALQQPAHVVALQPGASQRPPPNGSMAHDCPLAVQFAQVVPAVPHAVSSVPGTHVPPWQHPLQSAPQVVAAHC
jgi:hypothetical protein